MHAYRTIRRDILRGIALAAFVASIATAALMLAAGLASAATVAHTAAGTVTHSSSPAQQACTAFSAWEQHETAASLGRLVTAAAVLPRSYLKADAFQLAADDSSPSPKAAKYVTSDRKYVTEDCAKL